VIKKSAVPAYSELKIKNFLQFFKENNVNYEMWIPTETNGMIKTNRNFILDVYFIFFIK